MKRKDKALIPKVETVYNDCEYKGRELFRHLMRFAVLLCTVIGMNILINGMLGINAEPAVIILTALYAFSAFYLLFRSVKGLIAGGAILVFGMLITVLATGLSPKDIFVGGFIGIVNSVIDVLSSLGYVTVGRLSYDGVSSVGIFMNVSIVTSVTVGLSCRKKTHALPLIFLSAAICVLYASLGGKISISDAFLLISAIAAAAMMSVSDYHAGEAGRSALVGFTALLLAAALLLTPIVNINKAMDPVSFGGIEDIIKDLLSIGGESNVKRNPSPSRRVYTGRRIMTVYADTASSLYLRNWAGGSYKGEKWYSVDYDNGYSYADFARESSYFELTQKFIQTAKSIGYDREEIGISMTGVSIVLAARQKNLPLPSMSGRLGVLYDDGDTRYVSNTYDGFSSLNSWWKGKIMISAAVIDDYDNELLSDVIYGYYEYLVGYCGERFSARSDIGKEFVRKLYKYGNDEYVKQTAKLTTFAKSAYGEIVQDEAIDRAINEIFENTDIEIYFDRNSVRYGAEPFENNAVVYNGYLYELNDYGKAHALQVAKIVSDYLSDGRKYSINPKTTGKSVTEELLFGSKQGYCVQFATVGTLIMRKLGFYARYAEGYLAQDFKSSKGNYAYESKVVDSDAHAWTEVWIDGFGWMICEMTPGISRGNNVTIPPETSDAETSEPVTTPEDSSSEIIETSPPITETEPPHTDTEATQSPRPELVTTDEAPKGNGGGKIRFASFALTAVIIMSVGALIACAVIKGNKNKKRLMTLAERGLRSSTLNSAEIERIGELLTSALARALNAYGVLPDPGELPEDYGKRLDTVFKIKGLSVPPSICVEAMSKQIYKGIMNADETKAAALTLQALSKNALIKLGPVKFVWYRLKGDI